MIQSWARNLKAVAIALAMGGAVFSSGAALAQQPGQQEVAQGTTQEAGADQAAAAAVAPPQPGDVTAGTATAPAYVAPARLAPTPGIGQPTNGELYFQKQFSPIGQEALGMVNWALMPVAYFITGLVLSLLLWSIIRYREAANAVASRRSHNVTIEITWTLLPALVLLFLAFPSFRLLANQYSTPRADVTIKATGNQWYWTYDYPDYGDFSYDSMMLDEDEAKAEGVPYKLDVDNRIVVPTGAVVKVLIASNDVIHSFAIPAFWVKMDAVPGRINETWFRVDRPGVYYGQCSELCGVRHGFMPIAVEVRTPEDFRKWVMAKQAEDNIEVGLGLDRNAAATPSAAPADAAA